MKFKMNLLASTANNKFTYVEIFQKDWTTIKQASTVIY